jgi:mannosyltransferase OCH1-like enzyme
MKIPRIIHQTWKNHDIPEAFGKMALSWQEMHKDWEYLFWTDEMNRNFIKEHFGFFLHVYDNYPFPIQRVDAVRYFLLFKYGGFYIDMDFECLANIDPITRDSSCVFGKEPVEHCIRHGKDYIISNAFMGAVPNFHFFDRICTELQKNKQVTDRPNDAILESTGPFMLSDLYENYEKKQDIHVLEPDIMYPLTKDDLCVMESDGQTPAIVDKLKSAYGIHYYSGTWWKDKCHG